MVAAGGVTVERVNLRAPATVDADVRRAALVSLDTAAWPHVAAGDETWLILRSVSVAAAPWDIGARAALEATALDARAVDGWRAGAEDVAVRFASRADLLARLSRDLAVGTASHLWFWRSFLGALPAVPSRAIETLWSGEPRRLLDVVRALERAGALGTVLAALDPPASDRVLRAVAASTGWASAAMDDDGTTDRPSTAVARTAQVRALVLARHIPPGHICAPLLRLVVLIALWDRAPHLLPAAAGGAAQVSGMIRALISETPGSASVWSDNDREQAPPVGMESRSRPREPRNSADISQPPQVAPDGRGRPSGSPPARSANAAEAAGPAPEADLPSADPGMPMGAAAPLADAASDGSASIGAGVPLATDHMADESARFVTGSGGLFFLLNALDAAPGRAAMAAAGVSGWQWVWRLGVTLGLDPDPPLRRFVAARLDLPDPTALDRMPDPADADALFPALERRYAPTGVWDARLLARPAMVRTTRTHLDIDMRLDDVRLDVRRAGLDVDPGWLPWLGVVVSFHYGARSDLVGLAGQGRAR